MESPPPVGGVAGGELQGVALDAAGGVQMGTGAQVGELALLIEGDVGVLGQILDQLYLKGLRLLLHELDGLSPGAARTAPASASPCRSSASRPRSAPGVQE